MTFRPDVMGPVAEVTTEHRALRLDDLAQSFDGSAHDVASGSDLRRALGRGVRERTVDRERGREQVLQNLGVDRLEDALAFLEAGKALASPDVAHLAVRPGLAVEVGDRHLHPGPGSMDVDPELTDPLRQGRVGGQQLLGAWWSSGWTWSERGVPTTSSTDQPKRFETAGLA